MIKIDNEYINLKNKVFNRLFLISEDSFRARKMAFVAIYLETIQLFKECFSKAKIYHSYPEDSKYKGMQSCTRCSQSILLFRIYECRVLCLVTRVLIEHVFVDDKKVL